MDAISAAVILIGVVVVIVLLNHLGKSSLNTSVTTWTNNQLLTRRRTFDRMVLACVAANDAQRAQEYRERLDAIRSEIARRKLGRADG